MDAIINSIMAVLNSLMGQVSIVAVVVEFILRFIPSEKPIGIIHMVSGALKGLGMVFGKLAELLDAILPQKLIEPKQ